LAHWLGVSGSNFFCQFMFSSSIRVLTSALVDIHIALATLATTLRWVKCLDALNRSLMAVWVLGCGLGGVTLVTAFTVDNLHWDPIQHNCNGFTNSAALVNCVCLGSLVLCASLYLGGIAKMRWQIVVGGPTQQRIVYRAQRLLLIKAVVTTIPSFWTLSEVHLLGGGGNFNLKFAFIVSPLFLVGGLIDALVYLDLIHITQRLIHRMLDGTSQPKTAFPVGFGGRDVVNVSFSQELALETAERETAMIEDAIAMGSLVVGQMARDSFIRVEHSTPTSLTTSMVSVTSLRCGPSSDLVEVQNHLQRTTYLVRPSQLVVEGVEEEQLERGGSKMQEGRVRRKSKKASERAVARDILSDLWRC